MIFNKNQSIFPSDFHREIWWWAVGLVPPSDSLTNEVKSKCSLEVLEGCLQWYDYFNELCEDMYNNTSIYSPASARQYRDILEKISAGGKLRGNSMVWNLEDWEIYCKKLNRSKAYTNAGITLERCLKALDRTGFKYQYVNSSLIFSHAKYPEIFYAMHTMETSPDIHKTPARHHFAHCEFRQLFKSYSANYGELLRRASDESLYIIHYIDDFTKSLKIQRYIHFGIIKYKYKGIRVLDFNLYGNEYPTLRINLGTCANLDDDINRDEYYKVLLNQNYTIQDIFVRKLIKCVDESHKHYPVIINGQEQLICPCSKLRINPFKEELEAILSFISMRKASIDQYSNITA